MMWIQHITRQLNAQIVAYVIEIQENVNVLLDIPVIHVKDSHVITPIVIVMAPA